MAQRIIQHHHPSDLPLLSISPVRHSRVCFRDGAAPQRALERLQKLEVLKRDLIWALLGVSCLCVGIQNKATDLQQSPLLKERESRCPYSRSVSWLLHWRWKLHCQAAWHTRAGHSLWGAGSRGGRHTLVFAFLKP